jgi:hypothetical protein
MYQICIAIFEKDMYAENVNGTECTVQPVQPGRGPVNQQHVITLYGMIKHSAATFVND